MQTYTREVKKAPLEQVTDGKCNMGTFNGPIHRINPLDARKPMGIPIPRPLKNLRLKEWEALQIANEDWFLCLAVYNTKALGVAILMAYDRKQDKLYRYERQVPFWKLSVPRGLENSHCRYHSRNFNIDIYNRLNAGRIEAVFDIHGFKNLPDIKGNFIAHHVTEPIVIVQPFGENRPLYSHKALMPAEGELTFGKQKSSFKYDDSSIIVDDHKGYYPFVMKYDWVTGLGHDESGRLSGFNLTFNQVQDQEKFNENCLWLDSRMEPLPPITIKRPDGVKKTWEIRDTYGMVHLDFIPSQSIPIYKNLGLFASRYNGAIGYFQGFIVNNQGEKINFNGFPGMGEEKYIRM